MSRRIRFLLCLLAVAFSLATAACADTTAPNGECKEVSGSNTCNG